MNKPTVPIVVAMLAIASPVAVAKSVTVDNPATSPAKTSSVDDPGRVPYQFSSSCPGVPCAR